MSTKYIPIHTNTGGRGGRRPPCTPILVYISCMLYAFWLFWLFWLFIWLFWLFVWLCWCVFWLFWFMFDYFDYCFDLFGLGHFYYFDYFVVLSQVMPFTLIGYIWRLKSTCRLCWSMSVRERQSAQKLFEASRTLFCERRTYRWNPPPLTGSLQIGPVLTPKQIWPTNVKSEVLEIETTNSQHKLKQINIVELAAANPLPTLR